MLMFVVCVACVDYDVVAAMYQVEVVNYYLIFLTPSIDF